MLPHRTQEIIPIPLYLASFLQNQYHLDGTTRFSCELVMVTAALVGWRNCFLGTSNVVFGFLVQTGGLAGWGLAWGHLFYPSLWRAGRLFPTTPTCANLNYSLKRSPRNLAIFPLQTAHAFVSFCLICCSFSLQSQIQAISSTHARGSALCCLEIPPTKEMDSFLLDSDSGKFSEHRKKAAKVFTKISHEWLLASG